MKNTTFAFMFALISIFGIHSAASAQLLPGNAAILNTAQLAQFTNSQSLTVVNTAIPAAVLNTANLVPANTPVVAQTPAYAPIPVTVLNNANIGIISTVATNQLPQTSPQAYPNATLSTNNTNISTAINTFGTTTQNPVVTPVTTSSTGNTSYQSVGSYNYGSGVNTTPAAPTQVQPAHTVATVTHKTVTVNPIAESISQSIAEMPADAIDYSVTTDNQSAASTFGLGSVNLVTVLLAVAVLLAGMVAYQQYQDRKKKAQHAMYA